MPSGTTLTGVYYEDGERSSVGSRVVINISYPAQLPATPTVKAIGDPACTGTFAAPTAPAGTLCVYEDASNGLSAVDVDTWPVPAHSLRAFYLSATSTGIGRWVTDGSWAYTAP